MLCAALALILHAIVNAADPPLVRGHIVGGPSGGGGAAAVLPPRASAHARRGTQAHACVGRFSRRRCRLARLSSGRFGGRLPGWRGSGCREAALKPQKLAAAAVAEPHGGICRCRSKRREGRRAVKGGLQRVKRGRAAVVPVGPCHSF